MRSRSVSHKPILSAAQKAVFNHHSGKANKSVNDSMEAE